MSAVMRVLGPFVSVAVMVAGAIADEFRVRRGRRRVARVVEQATARLVPRLVPAQRRPVEPQPWWEFVPQDGDS